MKKRIIIVFGDPKSINSEIIFKSWKNLDRSIKKRIYLVANYNLILSQFKKLNYKIKCVLVDDIYEKHESDSLKIININVKFKSPFSLSKESSSKFINQSLTFAHKLALDKNVAGIINCSINKKLLSNKKIGVTEFLSNKCNLKKNSEIMLIYNKSLSVIPLTTHLDLKKVSSTISKSMIINKILKTRYWFKKNFRIDPKIAVLGLNPHNGEMRKNSEEIKKILPAVQSLKKHKLKIDGPLVADTIFIKDFKDYDIIVGMYHDQVLGPFKTLFKFDGINITLGLKYLRVSPDHGTAVNLIGKNKANPESLLKCINFISKF